MVLAAYIYTKLAHNATLKMCIIYTKSLPLHAGGDSRYMNLLDKFDLMILSTLKKLRLAPHG